MHCMPQFLLPYQNLKTTQVLTNPAHISIVQNISNAKEIPHEHH